MWTDYFFKKKKKKLADELSKVSLFEGIHKKDLNKIAKLGYIRRYEDKELIFKKEEPSYGIYIVLQGQVEIFLENKKKYFIIGNYHEHEFFGEFSLVKQSSRKASARANGETVLCYLFKKNLKNFFISYPKIGLIIYDHILNSMIEKIEFADNFLIKQNEKTFKQR